ncbi:g2599 [Coccomyxa viridis]|uniref:G2599 protein n=1 Tax=Coccomyxa viridis TaxID=1274662 RepID=A0ABP1FSQ9_9CHLO
MFVRPHAPAILPFTRGPDRLLIRIHCNSKPALSINNSSEELLDRFWQARGVVDAGQRQRLIDVALLETAKEELAYPGRALQGDLPGAGTAWLLESADVTAQVKVVSAKLLKLQSLFGEDAELDVAAMLIKEPRLAATDIRVIARRLLEMRLASGVQRDMLQLIQAQPSLLLQESAGGDDQQADTDEERRRAWEFGLSSDGQQEWSRRVEELRAYRQQYGDAHVGFRDNDAPELTRWAAKQRSDWRAGDLREDRANALEGLGFEFNEAKAEWMRWYAELAASTDDTMLGSGLSRDFYLYNWCSVQRIAKRSGALAPDRIALLNDIAFDWTGADALS